MGRCLGRDDALIVISGCFAAKFEGVPALMECSAYSFPVLY